MCRLLYKLSTTFVTKTNKHTYYLCLEACLCFNKRVIVTRVCVRCQGVTCTCVICRGVTCTCLVSGVSSLSEQVLCSVLLLVNRDLSDHCRHLVQYFNLFNMYSALGLHEKRQLLKVTTNRPYFSPSPIDVT